MEAVQISFEEKSLQADVPLPSSKSISNRLLVMEYLSGMEFDIKNLSESDDTRLMQSLLEKVKSVRDEEEEVFLDCDNAGTVMRFLTAVLSFKNGNWVLSGCERMKNRPIAPLVNALRSMGVDIMYLEKEGYPPLRVLGSASHLESGMDSVCLDASYSSQFTSALMMIAPLFPRGLRIQLSGEEKVSLPYVQLTAQLLRDCGVEVVFIDSFNLYVGGDYHKRTDVFVESDWTSASYIYAIMALAESGSVSIKYLKENSWQGDWVLSDWFEDLGVETTFVEDGVVLTKSKEAVDTTKVLSYNFIHHPDLAQTMAVCCAALGREVKLMGVGSLRYKETNRVEALCAELKKIGVNVQLEENENSLHIYPSEIRIDAPIEVYSDHRMAMAFSMLAMKYPGVVISSPEVVGKSFPNYWKALQHLGASLIWQNENL